MVSEGCFLTIFVKKGLFDVNMLLIDRNLTGRVHVRGEHICHNRVAQLRSVNQSSWGLPPCWIYSFEC